MLPLPPLRSPSLLAEACCWHPWSTCTAAEARFAERTGWLGPDRPGGALLQLPSRPGSY
jgi:hypothetical protein